MKIKFYRRLGAVIIAASICCLAPRWAQADPNVPPTFGAILPLTGGAADQGVWAKNGIELAVEERKKAGLNAPVVIYDDSRGDSKLSLAAYNNLRSRYSIPVVFSWGSGVGLALTPLVNREQVVQIGIATGTPDYRTEGDFTFRTFHSTLDEAAFADTVVDQLSGGGAAAVIKIQNDYGIGYGDELRRLMEKRGRTVVFDETFLPGETDFRPLLLKLKATRPKVIILITYPSEGALILVQRQSLGIDAPVLTGGAVLSSRSFFDVTGAAAEGISVIIPSNPSIEGSRKMRHFTEAYFKKYGEEIGILNWYAARGYDGYNLAADAAQACGSDAGCIKDRLFRVRNYVGAGGAIAFDSAGDIKTEFSVVRIHGKKFESEKTGS